MSDDGKPEGEPKETAPLPLVTGNTRPSQRGPASAPTAQVGPRRKPLQAPAPPPPKLEAGARVDRYVIEKLLGRGGMAEVYQAHDSKLKRKVALKVLHGDQKFYSQKKLLFEAQAAAHFEHPNSVIIYDVGETGDDMYIAMELVRGRRLSEFTRDLKVPLERKLRWLTSIARALAAAHRRGLVHRDIKPANVMIRDDDGEAKVLDFGIAREVFPEGELEGDQTDRGHMVGTIRYAAPEQIRGESVDGRADQYSWGITAFQLLTGRLPFLDQDTMMIASRVAFEETPSLRATAPDLPDPVIDTIDRALSKDPNDRFASMDEAADKLEAFAESSTSASRLSTVPNMTAAPSTQAPNPTPPTTGSRTPPLTSSTSTDQAPEMDMAAQQKASRRRWLYGAAAVASLGAVLGIGLKLGSRPPEAPAAASTRAEVAALKCAPATAKGSVDAELAKAVGASACARLGLEVGVPWGDANSAGVPLNTSITIGPDGDAEVTLEVLGKQHVGRAATPVGAVAQAAAALAGDISAPALGEPYAKAWGAKDDEGARRVERAWRQRSIALGDDRGLDARALLSTDAGSPIAHYLMATSGSVGGEAAAAARKAALSLAGELSQARKNMLEAALLVAPREVNRAEAARLLRVAYTAAPDDADIAAVFASYSIQWGLPEGYGALDRLVSSAPMKSLPALGSAIERAPKRDLDRIDKYAAKAVEIYPELRAAPPLVRALLARGKLKEARAALAFARRMGLDKAPAEPLFYAESAMVTALYAGEAGEARKIALNMVGDPRAPWQVEGGHGLAASHLLEGHASQAEAALWESADRHRGTGDEVSAVGFALRAMRIRRALKQLPVEPNRLDWLRRSLGDGSTLPIALRAEGLVEIALAQTGIDTFRVRTELIKQVEAMATALPATEAMKRDEILVKTVPLVRALRGDKPAIERWRTTEAAPFAVRIRQALDAALALEATGDLMGALATYSLAEDASNLEECTLERSLATHRLSKLMPRVGQIPEGAARKKAFEVAWKDAEPAARSALALIR